MTTALTRRRALCAALLALSAAPAAALGGCGSVATEASEGLASEPSASIDSTEQDDPYASGVHHVRIAVEGYGIIEAALNANVAPITVSNFCHLAEGDSTTASRFTAWCPAS